MSLPIYIDTNVYIDHFMNRSDYLLPLGEFAFQLLKRALDCEFDIIMSSLVLEELFYNSYGERINALIAEFESKGKIIHVDASEEDRRTAREICKERRTDVNDTVHAVIARRVNAAYLVTRNLRDFEELIDLIPIRLPELL